MDATNPSIQKKSLSFEREFAMLLSLKGVMESFRRQDWFLQFWQSIYQSATSLELNKAQLPRQRRAPGRFVEGSEGHGFDNVIDYYRKQLFEIIDNVVSCLASRADTTTATFLQVV